MELKRNWIVGLLSSTLILSTHMSLSAEASEEEYVGETPQEIESAVDEVAVPAVIDEADLQNDDVEDLFIANDPQDDEQSETIEEPMLPQVDNTDVENETSEPEETELEDEAEEPNDSQEDNQVETQQVTGEDFSLKILHSNDMHASIDDFAKISEFLNQMRSENDHSLYLDAGDIFSGNPVVDLNNGAPMIDLLNQLGLDLLTIGNHEFDYGQEAFQARREESNFNWLAANAEITDPSNPIEDIDPYQIFDFNGVSVGVLGITQAPPATNPAGIEGMAFNPYVQTALDYQYLRDQVDIFIALTHIGYADDVRLAEEVDFFDLIIGGHSHTQLNEPVVVNGTPIAHSGSNARNIGVIDVSIIDGVVSVEGRLQSIADLPDDAINQDVQDLIDGYNAESEELLSQVIGHTDTGLNRDARWEMDVALGNMITDALRNFANTDIGITNNGGIRANIEPGEITARDIFTVDPFGNVVTIIEMTGQDIKDILAYSYHRSLDSYGAQIDIQTSGMTYIIYTDEDGLYADADLFINGEPMDMDQTYSIATNSFIVDGGDGYDFSAATIIQEDAGQVTNALIQFIESATEAGESVNYEPTEGRIQTLPYVADEEDEVIDTSDLENLIEEAENINREEYTEDSLATLDQAVERAKVALASEDTDSYDNVMADLILALDELVAIETDDSQEDDEVVVEEEEEVTESDEESEEGVTEDETEEVVDVTTEDDKKDSAQRLPDTATSAWALGLVGIISTTAGAGIHKFRKKS